MSDHDRVAWRPASSAERAVAVSIAAVGRAVFLVVLGPVPRRPGTRAAPTGPIYEPTDHDAETCAPPAGICVNPERDPE